MNKEGALFRKKKSRESKEFGEFRELFDKFSILYIRKEHLSGEAALTSEITDTDIKLIEKKEQEINNRLEKILKDPEKKNRLFNFIRELREETRRGLENATAKNDVATINTLNNRLNILNLFEDKINKLSSMMERGRI